MKITYSPEFPELLQQLNCTIAISTYQSGKVILLSSLNGKHIYQFAKSFKRPMGIAVGDGGRVAVACKNTVEVLGVHKKLALNFKKDPGKYDGMLFPRATYFTGQLDLHDIEWEGETVIGVNTAFSCLCAITDRSSFKPFWQPSFITELVPEDRCHLNGLATNEKGEHYVTLLSKTDARQAWRDTKLESGMIMDTATETVLVDHLPMPHSPRFFGQQLFYLLAATGEVYVYDFETKENKRFGQVDGFARGMSIYEDYLFVGASTIRKTSTSFGDLPIAGKANHAGVTIFKISTGQKVASFRYHEKIEEIFDVAVIPELNHGVILDSKGEMTHRAVNITEDLFFWQKEEQ